MSREDRHIAPAVTRRAVVTGLLATLSAPAAARARPVIDARALGLHPHPRKDQTILLRRALAIAAKRGATLRLPTGVIAVRELRWSGPLYLAGASGAVLAARPGSRFLMMVEDGPVSIAGVIVDGRGVVEGGEESGVVRLAGVARAAITDCAFIGGAGNQLFLRGCSGRVETSRFRHAGHAAIVSLDGHRLHVRGNAIADCAANGVMIWQSVKRFDGAVVAANRIEHVRADLGGDGPYGNGVSVFRAAGVRVQGNRITHCAYSAIRDNAGDDCLIAANSCADLGEVAIFVEFGFRDVVVRHNSITRASAGIAATNLDHGGRGALVEGNVIRDIAPRIRSADLLGYGIAAEADAVIAGNLVEDAATCGLMLGWGRYLDDVTARANTLRRCRTGIIVSLTSGAGPARIVGNTIEAAERDAIAGYDHERRLMALKPPLPPAARHVTLAANRII